MPEEKAEKKSVFLFYGDDYYSSQQKLTNWKKAFIKKYQDENSIEVYEGKTLDSASFVTNLEAVPFLCEKKMIIIKDFMSDTKAEEQKKIAEAIHKTPDFCVLIFHEKQKPDRKTTLFKRIAKYGTVEEFKSMQPGEISRWILDRAKKEDIKISPVTANYLSNFTHQDLYTVSNELSKLSLFASGNEITTAMIDKLCTPSLTSSIFKLTDSIAVKKSREAIKILKILEDSGEELNRIFFMIVRHFRILLQVNEMMLKKENKFTMQKRLNQHPFVIQKAIMQSKNFTPEKLEQLYDQLLDIDIKVKTGKIKIIQGDYRAFMLAIEKLIIQCCQ